MRRRRIWTLIVLFILLLAGGAVIADRFLKSKRHAGLARFAKQLVTNYPKGFAVEPPLLVLEVSEREMETLRETVEAARQRGVILPEGRPYVNGEMVHEGQRSKVKLRIKGKMTDHVEGRKWSFRVVARKDGGFLGMRRFSLQHPGTRNYLVEWLQHQLMAGEGIVALRYGFIRLKLNDDDLGIYAYEEHFGPELLEHNGRVEGPLFRFDPGLSWEPRLKEMRGLRRDGPYAAYQAAALDAFGTGDLAKDATARARFEEAVALIEAFRRGELKASEVFEVDRMARRHALIDLMGGHHSMDWSDVKFYYDPVAQRVEPVAYEIFGGERIRNLAGSGRYEGRYRPSHDLHDAYFNDEQLFRAYVRHLERVSRPAYLDSALAALRPALDTATATIYREFPWKELEVDVFRHNQRVIRRLLDVPKGFHVYKQGITADTLNLMVVPVEGLPTEVHGLRLPDGTLLKPLEATVIPSRIPGRTGQPLPLRFALPPVVRRAKDEQYVIVYSVLGATVRRELEVFAHALPEEVTTLPGRVAQAPDMRVHPFIIVDEAERTVELRPGRWRMDRDLVIPAGYAVRGTAPLDLDLVSGARIISRSPIELTGLPDVPIRIGSSDGSGGGILVLDAEGISRWRYVHTTGFGPSARKGEASIIFHGSPARLRDVLLQEDLRRDLLAVVRTSAILREVTLVGGRDQLSAAYADLRVNGMEALGAGDDAVVIRGGDARLEDVLLEGFHGDGLKLVTHAKVTGHQLRIKGTGTGLRMAEGGRFTGEDLQVTTPAVAVLLEAAHGRYGPSSIEVKNARLEGGEGRVVDEGGNQVRIAEANAGKGGS